MSRITLLVCVCLAVGFNGCSGKKPPVEENGGSSHAAHAAQLPEIPAQIETQESLNQTIDTDKLTEALKDQFNQLGEAIHESYRSLISLAVEESDATKGTAIVRLSAVTNIRLAAMGDAKNAIISTREGTDQEYRESITIENFEGDLATAIKADLAKWTTSGTATLTVAAPDPPPLVDFLFGWWFLSPEQTESAKLEELGNDQYRAVVRSKPIAVELEQNGDKWSIKSFAFK